MTSANQSAKTGRNQPEANGVPTTSGTEHRTRAAVRPLLPQILSVVFISETRAAIKAGCADGIRWRLTSRAEGERLARELAAQLSLSSPSSADSARSRSNT